MTEPSTLDAAEEVAPAGVSVVVPVRDEAAVVASVLRQLQRTLAPIGRPWEIVVVDDASSDGSGDVARAEGARVIRHERGRGYGAGLKTGIHAATHDLIVIIDADGTYPVERIPDLLDAMPGAVRSRAPPVERPSRTSTPGCAASNGGWPCASKTCSPMASLWPWSSSRPAGSPVGRRALT